MTPKERLLATKNREEYEANKKYYGNLKPDAEIIAHLSKIYGKMYGGPEELYKTLPPKCPGQ